MVFARLFLVAWSAFLFGRAAHADLAALCNGLSPGQPGYYACSSHAKGLEERNRPLIAYWNAATQQMYVGDRTFHKDDHEAAKETWGKYNTKKPEGPGWIGLPESSYTSYMAMVNGHKQPEPSGSEVIYRNCVIEKSQNQPESVVKEIRAACKEISRNPSLVDRWKYGG